MEEIQKKNKNIYQIGNFVNFNLLQKNENSVSIINAEIIKPLLSTFFNDKYKLYGVLTLCSLINTTINENQYNNKIYTNSKNMFMFFEKRNWIHDFIIWMLLYMSELGYGIDLNKLNLNNKYFDLESLNFVEEQKNYIDKIQYIEFPYDLILKRIISYKQCNIFFNIFENIINKHLLNHSSKSIPGVYYEFKKNILKNINK